MSLAIHCDCDVCDSWAKTGSHAASLFLTVSSDGEEIAHACCFWCLARYAAERGEPTEEGEL